MWVPLDLRRQPLHERRRIGRLIEAKADGVADLRAVAKLGVEPSMRKQRQRVSLFDLVAWRQTLLPNKRLKRIGHGAAFARAKDHSLQPPE